MKTLEQMLKSGKREERFTAMDALAETAGEHEITELRRVAEGSRRRYLAWYDMQDQIYALNRLVDTKVPGALDYVRQFFRAEVSEVSLGYEIPIDTGGGINGQSESVPAVRQDTTYPNAHGDLGLWLERSTSAWEYRGIEYRPEPRISQAVNAMGSILKRTRE